MRSGTSPRGRDDRLIYFCPLPLSPPFYFLLLPGLSSFSPPPPSILPPRPLPLATSPISPFSFSAHYPSSRVPFPLLLFHSHSPPYPFSLLYPYLSSGFVPFPFPSPRFILPLPLPPRSTPSSLALFSLPRPLPSFYALPSPFLVPFFLSFPPSFPLNPRDTPPRWSHHTIFRFRDSGIFRILPFTFFPSFIFTSSSHLFSWFSTILLRLFLTLYIFGHELSELGPG